MEYTQEQLDAMIAEAKKGLFTEDELTKRVTSEVDRRVESGIQKGLETQKQKWERELAEKAKLSAEELAKKEFEEKVNGLTAKEKEIQKKANRLEAVEMLTNASIPKSQYEKVMSVLISDDENATKANVQNFIDVFNSTKAELETKIRGEASNVKPPETSGNNGVVTKQEFDKMGYADKLKFKQANPELYKKFTK